MKKPDYWFWLIVLLSAVLITYGIIGCNAIHGLGQDIKTISEPYTTGQ